MRDFHMPGRSAVYATNGLCATSHPLAAKVAVQILESGGNAVDAAIAGAVLLGICEPQMTGIGGDCFILLSESSGQVIALNGSGRAPKNLSAEQLRATGLTAIPDNSVDAVTVPGAVDAFCKLSNDYGKLGLPSLLAPAIHYAKAGVPVAPRTAFDWGLGQNRLQGCAKSFYLLNGKEPKVGQVFRAPNQAKVLQEIALNGRDAFYEGEIAEDMVNSLNALGGVHNLDDFAETKCQYTEPIFGNYKGTDLIEHPPNSQGATAILMNNILTNFDISSLDPLGSKRAHLEAEAAKLAYDARNRFIADPDRGSIADNMLSANVANRLADFINLKQAISNSQTITEQVHKDTVYICVVDKDQMAVSLIYSIYQSFGSGLASEKFGINFQNRGCGFNLIKGHPNEAKGGNRPMHTIIPGMLRKNDRVIMPFGVMGGAYQPNGHVRFMSNMLDFGMDSQHAIDAPRSFTDGGMMMVERGYNDKVRSELAELGHNVVVPDIPIGGAQSIFINYDKGVLEGASDPRKDGCAIGY